MVTRTDLEKGGAPSRGYNRQGAIDSQCTPLVSLLRVPPITRPYAPVFFLPQLF